MRGVTLMELMIVVVIIGILTANCISELSAVRRESQA
jgi:prepilin-type N-terminal cleavage/methylation domain-containing protein